MSTLSAQSVSFRRLAGTHAMLSALEITVNPPTSATAINMAFTIRYLCGVDKLGYFEGDVTSLNPVSRPSHR